MRKLQVKICGLKHEDNVRDIVGREPDYIGFIFYHASPRNAGGMLSYEFINSISSKIKKVGVFVNDSEDRIINYIALYNLDYVQLHGNENPEFCERIKKYCKVIKAFGVNESFDFSCTAEYKTVSDLFLFDTKTPGHGGSGKTFNWGLLKNYKENIPFLISGGIGEENSNEVLNLSSQLSHFAGIDVNSKIEIEPGIKDIAKVNLIIAQLKKS